MEVEAEEEKFHDKVEEEEEEEQVPPEPISCRSIVMDVEFHPTLPIVCGALVSSEVEVWKREEDGQFKRIARLKNLHRGEACRTITFEPTSGISLFTGGSDGGIHAIDATKGTVVWTCKKAHEGIPVNRISSCVSKEYGPWCVLSGDEEGNVKLWDIRQNGESSSKIVFPKSHDDFISDFCYHEEEKRVISTGGDGLLVVYDLRKPGKVKGEAKSEPSDTELLSVLLVKGNKRVLTGTQEGHISVWNWGNWFAPTDAIKGHPSSVDCMLKVDENVILTGSSDGMIRIVKIQPNKLLGVIGFHDDFPVERMSWAHDRRLISTCSHDNLIRFWDTSFLINGLHDLQEMDIEGGTGNEEDDDDDDFSEEDDDKVVKRPAKKKQNIQDLGNKRKPNNSSSFFDDL